MKNIILLALTLSAFFLSSCATLDPICEREKYLASIKERLTTITIEDGISFEEAKIISDNYFSRFKRISGGWSEPYDKDNFWEIKQLGCVTGAVLEDASSLLIEKSTGRITWTEGPTIDNPLDIWKVEY